MGRISMAMRDELVVTVTCRYGRASRLERGRILDEFVAVAGPAPQACDAAAARGPAQLKV